MAEDLRLYADFFEHPKTQLLKQRLGCEGILALQRLWCAAVNNWRDGNLSGKSDSLLEMAAGWTGETGALIRALREAGFLDGKEGAIFHFLHAIWFRLLVDIKLDELQRQGARG